MLSFPGAARGDGATIESPFLLRSFSTFFRFINFLTFFLKLSCGCDVFIFIVGGFLDVNPFASFCWMSEWVFPKSRPKC